MMFYAYTRLYYHPESDSLFWGDGTPMNDPLVYDVTGEPWAEGRMKAAQMNIAGARVGRDTTPNLQAQANADQVLWHWPFPDAKCRLIYMDPPWQFVGYTSAGTPHRTAEDHYATMTLDDLKALPVADLALPDCALVLWTIGSHLKQAIELGESYGFTYQTDLLYWIKVGKGYKDGVRPISMGHWTRKQVEMALLFTRGSPGRISKGVRQLIEAEVAETIYAPKREHSRKPDEAYARLETLIDGPRIELFARPRPGATRQEDKTRKGWYAWGNEITWEVDPYAGL